jgi:two-component system sensor histidine kinase KdpD
MGRSRHELLGRTVWEMYPAAVGSFFEREFRRAIAERMPVAFEGYWAPRDKWFAVSAYPSSDGGLIIYSRNITEKKRAEAEIVRKNAELAQLRERAAEDARKGQELKSALLDALAHEMKSPLASIKIAVTTLASSDSKLDAEQRLELLGVIDRNTDRLDIWSTQTIDLAALEGGTLDLKNERHDIGQTIRHIAGELAFDFEGTPVDVQVEDTPCEVRFDIDMVKHVLSLLLDNASKYSPRGSPVTISFRCEADAATVSVKDSGPGIPVDEQDRIFEKYYRGRHSRETRGTGLGLAIASSIIRAQGGALWVVSEPGHGSVFHFSLPRLKESQ